MQLYDRGALKDFLTSILEQIELDPEHSTLQLSYRIPLRQSGGFSMASPANSSAKGHCPLGAGCVSPIGP